MFETNISFPIITPASNHIQAKFNKPAKWREAVVRVLLVYLDYFVSFSKLEIFANCV